MKNPLKIDPTRTTLIRHGFSTDMRKRFRKLVVSVESYDTNQTPESFLKWIEDEIGRFVLASDPVGNHWTDYWIRKAYLHGAGRAYGEVNREELSDNIDFYIGGKNQFLRQLVGYVPIHYLVLNAKSRLKILLIRTFKELEGISGTLAQKMARTLSQGLMKGESRDQLLKRLKFEISDITKRRAIVLARTEIIRANATGKLDAYADLGITEVEIEVEFVTAGDSLVCPVCKQYEGKIFTLEEIQDIIPVHPECRCEPRIVKRRPK